MQSEVANRGGVCCGAMFLHDDEMVLSGWRVTPENADLFPLPRCSTLAYRNGSGGGCSERAARSDDFRGFRSDRITPFLADAFLRNSPFTDPTRVFETCKAMVRERPCSKKKPKKPPRKKAVHSLPQREILKAQSEHQRLIELIGTYGMAANCDHPDACIRGESPRTWRSCPDCGLNYDFQGDWSQTSDPNLAQR